MPSSPGTYSDRAYTSRTVVPPAVVSVNRVDAASAIGGFPRSAVSATPAATARPASSCTVAASSCCTWTLGSAGPGYLASTGPSVISRPSAYRL
jgi:hypothetical protein